MKYTQVVILNGLNIIFKTPFVSVLGHLGHVR